ncbi:MAG: DUF1835 domain-containing protein [Bacteroidia bacterium]|nr:DUF1835 domain-containing protein [Bacteroidia bacterium]NND09712.1 DUF1835 domain-containing protein [Flavobacteriaceae bacterium]NNK27165.1 DUF1835 domain-containing protein [Flavobacteriaceae bacterium]RZV65576.1 MAG: DUF1835 domain-containing protein [Flavobacteriaceae bacterium]
MKNNSLHITNGSNLTDLIPEIGLNGDILTWNEMLCEGPTHFQIDSKKFLKARESFFKDTYNIDFDDYKAKFISEIEKLNNDKDYSEIVLWFEYDLFCHINLIAAISLLWQKQIDIPIYLVCSGWVDGEKQLKGLSELTPEQLLDHYNNKTLLTKEDIDIALDVWRIYCGDHHNSLKPYITRPSSFKYLSNCLKAHLKRFPNTENGLCTIENNILAMIDQREIKTMNQLMGYALTYQGYYGYGDTQIQRIIDKLKLFIDDTGERLVLNDKGQLALQLKYNFSKELANDMAFGGVERLDYQFDDSLNKLLKIM